MKPQFDADEDLGSADRRYRKVHAQTIVPGVDGTGIAAGNLLVGLAGGLKVARGQHTTVTAADTVATGLTIVLCVVASLESSPVPLADRCQAAIGDQAGAPVAGSIVIITSKPTATADTAPIPATIFSKKVNWIAVGT